MIKSTKILKALIVTGLLVVVQACSTTSPDRCLDCPDSAAQQDNPVRLGLTTFQPELVIANDIVNALVQVPNIDARSTVLKIPNSNSTFMSALRDVLIDRGFRVERASRRTGKGVLMVSTLNEPQNKTFYTYIVAIDRLALKRTYVIENRVIAPVSSLFVRGVSPSLISLNDGLFIE